MQYQIALYVASHKHILINSLCNSSIAVILKIEMLK